MKPRILLLLATLLLATGGGGLARGQAGSEAAAMQAARREAREAALRSHRLEREAAEATSEAARARAALSAIAARIEAAEADITAAESRIRIVEAIRARQRAKLAEKQEPVARLAAALQIMGRRPPALALVRPGSIDELIRVRSMLASTLPVIRERTASLRAEVEAGNALRRQAEEAVAELQRGRGELRRQRIAFARFEAEQRRRSSALAAHALSESDRAMAFDEEARELSALLRSREEQARIRRSLEDLPGPLPRPGGAAEPQKGLRYVLPVEGKVVTGMGELSEAGVHARGITFDVLPQTPVRAPRPGRIVFAGRFRSYGNILIIDHGSGWTTLVTNLGSLAVARGARVVAGSLIGRSGSTDGHVTVELRKDGRPFPIAPLIASA